MGQSFDGKIYSTTYYGDSNTPLTWRELYLMKSEENTVLQAFQRIVVDLDRNENGRHEGDVDVGDPSGVSQGNPNIQTGQTFAYDISGRPYVMPERKLRHNPAAWIESS